MSTLILVHGAWHGGWCWDRVKPILESRGHRVLAPCLSGLGSKFHLLSPENSLSHHQAEILHLIQTEQLSDFLLCGHSYGGLVVGSIASRIAEQLRCLAYLDAYVPEPGKSGLELRTPEANRRLRESIRDDWLMPPPPAAKFGLTRAADIEWVDSMLSPMAIGCFNEKVVMEPNPDSLNTAYLRTAWPNQSLDNFHEMGCSLGWHTVRWECGHDMMVEAPERTSEFLLQLLEDRPRV